MTEQEYKKHRNIDNKLKHQTTKNGLSKENCKSKIWDGYIWKESKWDVFIGKRGSKKLIIEK